MKEKIAIIGEKYHKSFIWILILGFFAAYLSLCFNNNIWTDEAFTIDLLKNSNSMKEAIHGTIIDVHPPLYYIICRLVTNVTGIHLFVLKVLSIIPMILTMIFGGIFARKRFGEKTAFLYVLMLGVIPCCMEYSIQVRMYSWALLFVTLCGIFAYEAYIDGKRKDWILAVLSGVAAAYTHYFALVAVGWIYGIFFLVLLIKDKKKLWKWVMAVIASVVGYGPWLAVLLRQVNNVSNSYWIGEIDGEVILSYFSWLFGTDLPYMTLLFCILYLIGIIGVVIKIRQRKGQKYWIALICLLIPFATAVSGVVVSNIMRPIFIARYLLPTIGFLSLFFAIIMSELEQKVYISLLCFLVFVGAVVYKHTYFIEYHSTFVPQTEAFFEEHLGENDLLTYNFYAYGFIYEYYWDKDKMAYLEDVDFSKDYDNIWVMFTHMNAPIPQDKLQEYGWSVAYMGNYGIEHDEFKIYRIYKQ